MEKKEFEELNEITINSGDLCWKCKISFIISALPIARIFHIGFKVCDKCSKIISSKII